MEPEEYKLKLNAQILEEAADWLVEFSAGDVDAGARQTFDTWLRTSPEHVRAYLELIPIWEEGALPPPHPDAGPDALIALARNADNIVTLTPKAGEVSQPATSSAARLPRRRTAIAASAVLACVAGGILAWLVLAHNPPYTSQVGEQRSIALPDGSLIELNARSSVRVRFTSNERAVQLLEGQALFRVAKDPARPFIVESDGTRVRAVGTQFDVYRKKTSTTVTVLEGRVTVAHAAAESTSARTPHRSCASCKRSPGSASLKGTMRLRSPGTDRSGAVSDFTRISVFMCMSPSHRVTATTTSLLRGGGVLVRIATVATAICLLVGLSVASDGEAAMRRPTNIPAQGLRSALQTLSKEREFQVVFRTDLVGDARTSGAVGDLTLDEALKQLLTGTGLTYRYLDDKTVTILPVKAQEQNGVSTNAQVEGSGGATSADKEGKKSSSDGFRVVQADQGQAQGASTVESERSTTGDSDKLEEVTVKLPEILVKGSRIMNVDVKRTEDDVQPYYILDSKQIQQSGATNVEEFLKQRLTMNTTIRSNSQAYPGFSIAGSTSSVNLRGLGSNETLILINGRRSAGVSIQGTTNQPDINGIPLSAIERIEVLPSSASAIYGGAAVGGVVNIILKKNFKGGEFNATYENTTQSNAPLRSVNATYGVSLGDGKTRVMVTGHYSDGEILLT